jgi:beta-glucosidase
MTKEPLFPFGFGLSYTQFEYSDIKLDKQVLKQGEKVEVSVNVKNTGGVSGDEVIQLYITSPGTDFRVPLYDLKGFERFHLEAEESKTIKFQLNTDDFMNINEKGEKVLVPGEYIIYTGGSLPNQRSIELGASQYLDKRIKIEMSF